MDSNPHRVKSITFREPVRVPGRGETGYYLTSEDHPITYFPELGLIRASLKPGIQPMPNQAAVRYYGIGTMKDMDLIDEPVETAVREQNGVLTVTQQVRANADGSFERVTDDAPTIMRLAPGIPAPKQKRARKAKADAAPQPIGEPNKAQQAAIRPIRTPGRAPSMGSGTGATGGGV